MRAFIPLLFALLAVASLHGAEPPRKRTGKTFISVYTEADCKGRATRIEVPANLPSDSALMEQGVKNDSIRSMKVPAGVTVTVCDGSGYGGDRLTFAEGEHKSMGTLDFRITSLKAEFTGTPKAQ